MRVSTAFNAQRGIDALLEQQKRLAELQEQLSSGKRLLKPSDDPTGTSQVLRLNQAITETEQYQRNANNALNRLSLEESTLDSVQNSLLRIRELTVQGANSTLGNSDRAAIAQEVRERLSELLGLANTRDANQEYLFSGYQVTNPPFSQTANGTLIYNGDQGQRSIQVSSGRQIPDSDSGNDVFVDIKNGNGTFQVNAPAGNTGSGIIDVGSLVDATAYVADTYTVTFAVVGNVTTYGVTGATSGVVIPAGTAYTSDAAITFNGIETSISGAPANGDTFTISPSTKQDMFSTVQKLIAALETSVSSPETQADFYNAIEPVLSEIDLAFENVTQIRTDIGARLKSIDDQVSVNEAFKIEMQKTLSTVQDLDYTGAVTELQTRLTSLQAAQATYTRVQGLSLFNFI